MNVIVAILSNRFFGQTLSLQILCEYARQNNQITPCLRKINLVFVNQPF